MKYKYQGPCKPLERHTRKTPRRSTILIRKVNNKPQGKKRNMARRIAEVSMCGSCFTTLLEDVKSGFLEDTLNGRKKVRRFSRHQYRGGNASSFKRKPSIPAPSARRCSKCETWSTREKDDSRGTSQTDESRGTFQRDESRGTSQREHLRGTSKRDNSWDTSKRSDSWNASKRSDSWDASKKSGPTMPTREGRVCKIHPQACALVDWVQPREVKVCSVRHVHPKQGRRSSEYSRDLNKCLDKFQTGIERDLMWKRKIAQVTQSRVEKQFQQFNEKLKSLDEEVKKFLEVEIKRGKTRVR